MEARDPRPAQVRPKGRRRLAALLVTGGVLAGAGTAYAVGAARSAGPDYTYGGTNPFVSASATVHVVTPANDSSRVLLKVSGIDAPAGQTFGAHVHQLPCGALPTDSGGHYAHSTATGTLEARELWLDFTVDEDGFGIAKAARPWVLDETTQRSVVIHALPTNPDTGIAGARLACIDLDGTA